MKYRTKVECLRCGERYTSISHKYKVPYRCKHCGSIMLLVIDNHVTRRHKEDIFKKEKEFVKLELKNTLRTKEPNNNTGE